MGKTDNLEAATAVRGPEHVIPAETPYERFKKENLNVLYLKTDADVRQAAKHVKQLNPSVVGFDIETASKTGSFGALSGSFDGSIRLFQLGFKEPGIEPFQIVIDCHEADPKPFLPLLRDPKVEKQIHYQTYEQSWCLTHLGVSIKNIYDTCIASRKLQKALYERVIDRGLPAARAAGDPDWSPSGHVWRDTPADSELRKIMEEAGYQATEEVAPGWRKSNDNLSSVASYHIGIDLPKEEQVSDWSQPVITPDQIIYAAMDVAILPDSAGNLQRISKELDVHDDIVEAVERNRLKIVSRVSEKDPELADDSIRVRRALNRAKTKSEIDSIQHAAKQMTIRAKTQGELKQFYAERRSELPA